MAEYADIESFWDRASMFIDKISKNGHSFIHGNFCNDCKDDFKETVKFVAHEFRTYICDSYNTVIYHLEKNESIDETLKKRLIEELKAREYEFETIIIRALEDWGITMSDKELIGDAIDDWFKRKEVDKK